MFDEMNKFTNELDQQIEEASLGAFKLEKQLGSFHNLVGTYDAVKRIASTSGVQMKGYLFKRSSNAFKTWNRRWFYLTNNQLLYRKRTGKLRWLRSIPYESRRKMLEHLIVAGKFPII